MKWFRIKTLQKRLVLFLMLPATLILLTGGIVGFVYARREILLQWQEMATLKLERAAHYIDMRLDRPMAYIEMFNNAGLIENGMVSRESIVRQIETVKGVARVTIKIDGRDPRLASRHSMRGSGFSPGRDRGMMRFHRGVFSRITHPRHDASLGAETVSLISSLLDEEGKTVGRLEVAMRFDYLISDIISLGWWQSHAAGVVNDEGHYLMHTQIFDKPHDQLGETGDPLESSIRKQLGEVSGTQLGPGHPAKMVAGFYRLKKAPWTIVMFASGDKILQPIIRFRNYFFAGWAVFTLLLLAIIRMNVSRIVGPIRTLSKSAEAVSHGRYGEPITSRSHDEIGQLIDSYNRMVDGLKERDLIRNTFGRYVDPKVARKLLSQPEFTSIGGTKREVVILMADIRGFTPLAEGLEPDAVIRLLNHYFSFMIDITHQHDGIIVDFIGDGLLVFFEPMGEAIEETACRAYQCAHDMQAQMTALNKILQQEKLPGITIGIGLNSGEVIVGNIGSNKRTKYGIVGAEVNLTQRIQAQAGAQEIVVAGSLFRHMSCRLKIVREFTTEVKGIQAPVQLYVVDEPTV